MPAELVAGVQKEISGSAHSGTFFCSVRLEMPPGPPSFTAERDAWMIAFE